MKISRDELYRRVWETPVRTLAKEFDISDVGLAKVCRKNQIPLPPVGYWTKVQHGIKVSRPPLARSPITEIVFDASRNRTKNLNLGPDVPKLPAVQVELPTTTENLASFAAATLNRLRKAKADERGMVTSRGTGVFDCYVGLASAERVAKLLHAIETALHVVESKLVRGKEEELLCVEHDGQRVRFAILEKYSRTEHVVKDKQHSWMDTRHFTYTLSGKLTLQIEGHFDGRKCWSDGVRSTLEEKLSSIVTGLAMAAKAIKQRAIDAELQRQRWAEEARQREERERIRREEEEFRRILLAESQAWSDCQTTL